MKEIDRMIREALRDRDAELLEQAGGEQAIHQTVIDVFRSKSRWLVIGSMLATLGLVILAVFAAMEFYSASATRDMLVWGAVCFYCLTGILGMKIWFWLEMSKVAVLREVKRLELQVAFMAMKQKPVSEKDQ